MAFIIDKDKCTLCGKCVRDCVCGALKLGEKSVEVPQYCINCQHCLAICPTGAISFDTVKAENCRKVPEIGDSEYESLCKIMEHRHSIRQYKKDAVDPKIITEILHQLRYIPTGCNFHDLQIRILSGKKLDELRKICAAKVVEKFDNGEIKKPFSGVLGSMRDGLAAGMDLIFRDAPCLAVVAINKKAPCPEDGIIALTNFELLANAKKLGTCWCGVGFWIFKFIAPELTEYLNLGSDYTIAHSMLFGYPSVEYARVAEPKGFDFKLIDGE